MAKPDFKKILLEKGEKIALFGALGGLGLLGVLGVVAATSAESAGETTKEFKTGAEGIRRSMKSTDGKANPLPAWVDGNGTISAVDAGQFALSGPLYFDPVELPSKARENPKVSEIIDAQIDLVRAPMKAYDILDFGPDQPRKIGVIAKTLIKPADAAAVDKLLKGNRNRLGQITPPRGNAAPPPGVGGATPPPGGRGGPPAGMMGGGMMGGGMMGGGSGAFDPRGERFETSVKYVPLDQFDDKKDAPALTVYPTRMVIVHAAFPLKAQLEEIRRALKLATLDDARREATPGAAPAAGGGAAAGGGGNASTRGGDEGAPAGAGGPRPAGGAKGGPEFVGIEVERRITTPNGITSEWEPYDHVARYVSNIWSRKFADQPDDGYLSYFLRYDQMLATPLPLLSEGVNPYPKIEMQVFRDTVGRMEALRKPKVTPSEQQKKFGGKVGENNPFVPQQGVGGPGAGGGEGFGNFFGDSGAGPGVGRGGMTPPAGMMPGMPGGAGMPPGSMTPPAGMMPGSPGGMMPGRGGPGGPGGMFPGGPNTPAVATDTPENDLLLLRFLDVDVKPGHAYQYRLRVVMKNPNFGRKDTATPDMATKETLKSPWSTINNIAVVQNEQNLYAADPAKYAREIREKNKDSAVVALLDNDNGKKPVVQIQQWMEQVSIDTKREPVGNWVVAEVPVGRGEYIGKKQIVSLPMWSAEKASYLLQELARYKVRGAKEQPKGLLVEFRTNTMLVDYEGGKERRQVGDRAIDDESNTELLVLTPDNRVLVKNSAVDAEDLTRIERETHWAEWVKKVTETTKRVGTPTGPGNGEGAGGFGRGGGN